MSLIECGYTKAITMFMFLSKPWGKGLTYAFLVVIALSNEKVSWLEYIIVALFGIAAIFNMYMGCRFSEEEN